MGRTKALVEIDGVAMAARVIAALRALGAVEIVLAGGDPVELDGLGVEVVADPVAGAGPLGGVVGALEHLRPRASHVLVVPCDVGLLEARTLRPLLDASAREPSHVVVARTDRLEAACAIWPTSVAPALRAALDDGRRALHRAIEELAHTAIAVDPDGLVNMNAPGDLPR